MPTQRHRAATWIVAAGAATLIALVWALHWDPRPQSSRSFDQARNGLWLGHRWYTGVGVRDGQPVDEAEFDELVETLEDKGIRYGFVHVGPVRRDGRIDDPPGALLEKLMAAAPEVVWLAWLGARVENTPLRDRAFRSALNDTLHQLRDAGFVGVHFDFEPLHDRHPGYLAILDSVREELGPGFVISQATPRAGPFGRSGGPLRASFWSEDFYRETMARTDQTVVMAYDTQLSFTKGYVAFVRHQTALLGQWACDTEGHELLIGVPSYEDVPIYSDPQVENLRTASQGVRAALEEAGGFADCFAGVAVYAYWVTDPEEWQLFDEHWASPGTTTP